MARPAAREPGPLMTLVRCLNSASAVRRVRASLAANRPTASVSAHRPLDYHQRQLLDRFVDA